MSEGVLAMGSSSEMAENMVGPAWEVGPTEDVVHALIETLVDPLLPLSVSNVSPPEDDQISVAKQMHAVVLLYNYHHRKQKPELKFLDFVSFAKLAVVVKPPLTPFMKLTIESESKKFNISDDQFSITEEAIKHACNIAMALDESRDFPNTEPWPISSIAVLLIDSKKENCMLRFGDVTKGVWSLIEKELDECKNSPHMLLEEKIGEKRKLNFLKALNNGREFLQLGYDAVKDVTGIGRSDLQVLGVHATYSLRKEKSAVRFYMMQCSGSFDVKEEVSLKFLVESLQGPLAEKLDFGLWKTTTVVEFYHMLPYVQFISHWLSGKVKKELTQTGTSDLPVSKIIGNMNNYDDNVVSEDCDENKESFDEVHGVLYLAKNKKIKVDFEMSDTDSEKTVINTEKLSIKREIGCLLKREENEKNLSSKIRVYHHRRKNNDSPTLNDASLTPNDARSPTPNDTRSPTPHDARVQEDGGSLKVDMEASLKSNHIPCGDENVDVDDKDDVTILFNQNGVAATGNQVVQFKSKSEVQNLSVSEELKNALELLCGRRRELYSQMHSMEDKIVSYESDFARIREGDADLARECIKSILSGSYGSTHEPKKTQKGFSAIFLFGKSSYQDLLITCEKNNWPLPHYLTQPSANGKFVSEVNVRAKDLELHAKGEDELKPSEARESAAAQMIAKLNNLFSN